MRFEARRMRFGARPAPDEDEDGLPGPARIRLRARRAAGIAEAAQILEHIPEPGESVHAIYTARMDLTDVCAALFERLGKCDRMLVATLGYNGRNLRQLLAWLDTGAVDSLGLVASKFFRSHQGALWATTLQEFRQRGHRAACCDSHAKVVAMHFAGGQKLAIEGSANLCGSGSSGREQLTLIRDDGITDWHERWIADLIDRHEGEDDGEAASRRRPRAEAH